MNPFYYPIPKLTIGFMGGVFLSNFVVLELGAIGLGIALVVSVVLFFHFKKKRTTKQIHCLSFFVVALCLAGIMDNPAS